MNLLEQQLPVRRPPVGCFGESLFFGVHRVDLASIDAGEVVAGSVEGASCTGGARGEGEEIGQRSLNGRDRRNFDATKLTVSLLAVAPAKVDLPLAGVDGKRAFGDALAGFEH